MPPRRDSALLAFLLLGVSWGANFYFMKVALAYIGPLQVAWLRVAFGMLPIVGFALARRAFRREDLRHFHHSVIMSLLAFVIPFYGLVRATQLLPSGIAGVMAGTIPLVSLVVFYFTGRDSRLGRAQIAGLVTGFAGIALLSGAFEPHPAGEAAEQLKGIAFMLLGVLGFAGANVYTQRRITPLRLNAIALTAYQTILATIVLGLLTPFEGMSAIVDHPAALTGVVLGLGLFGTGIAFVLYYFIIERMGLVTASSVFYLPPVVALAIGALVRGERLLPLQFGGCVLVLAGIVLARRPAVAR